MKNKSFLIRAASNTDALNKFLEILTKYSESDDDSGHSINHFLKTNPGIESRLERKPTTLYRGFGLHPEWMSEFYQSQTLKPFGPVMSWTKDRKVAEKFANYNRCPGMFSFILKVNIKEDQIIADMEAYGLDAQNEQEVLTKPRLVKPSDIDVIRFSVNEAANEELKTGDYEIIKWSDIPACLLRSPELKNSDAADELGC